MSPLLRCILLASALAANQAAHAQGFPAKPMRVIIPFAPGGPSDVMGRLVAQSLTKAWGVQAVAENRSGAGGNIGVEMCAKAPPDGYTMCTITVAQAVSPSIYRNPVYDPVKDFSHVTLLAILPSILTVHPSLPVKNVRDLVAVAKARPGQLTFSSAGNGTSPHMMMEMLKWMAGIDIVHVPYKGLVPALFDQISGQIQLGFNTAITVVPYIKSDKLRAIATSSKERFPLLPDLVSVGETIKGFDGNSWQGLVMPAKTPHDIVMKVYNELAPMLKSPETRERFLAQGAIPSGIEPDQFAAFVKNETEKWAKVAKATGVMAE